MIRALLLCLLTVGLSIPAGPAGAQSPRALLEERLRTGVVRIAVQKQVLRQSGAGNLRRSKEWFVGSGFWVAGTDRIVTCAHVVEGARQITIQSRAKKKAWSSDQRQISLCLMDPAGDIAILKVPENGPGQTLATAAELSLALSTSATEIISVGHTEDVPWRVNYGRLTQREQAETHGIPLPGDVLICDVLFGPGSSGGIVADHRERILGMIEGGMSKGIYGNRIAIQSTTIEQALRTMRANPQCRDPLDKSGKAIFVNEDKYSDLIRERQPDRNGIPPGLWGQASYGFLTGIDRFDDVVPTLRLDALKPANNALTWTAGVEWAQRRLTTSGDAGTVQFTDVVEIRRVSITGGARYLIGDFGRVSVFSGARAGYVHDVIDHEYAFDSPLFAPQSYTRPVSGVLGALGLDIEVQVIGNLRVSWGGEVWQGSGGVGNGVANRLGLRMGVFRATS